MPKVKQLYGLNSISSITKSPKNTTNRLNGSQTQPATNRLNAFIEVECERKDCMTIKWNGIQTQHHLQTALKELERYKTLYLKERRKIGDTYREIEEVMFALTKKEKEMKKKETQLLELEQTNLQKQQQNEAFNQSLKAMNKQLTERENQLSLQEQSLNQQISNQNKLIDDLNQLKSNLESSVHYLEQKESQLFASLQELNQQEQDTLKRVEHVSQFLQNTGEHFQMIQSIEELFRQKTTGLENLKTSVLQKQEELQYYEQQLQLRSVCASLNEAAFMKRVAQTERLNQQTPNSCIIDTNQRSLFKNQNNQQNQPQNLLDNQLFSTICSRENSPISNKESFKIIKKPYMLNQVPMTEINNFDMKI